MDYSEQLNEHHKRSIIALLIRLSKADNSVENKEKSYMIAVCNAIGLDYDEIPQIAENLEDYPLYPPTEEPDRMEILYYLLFQMKIDGKASEEEAKLIQEFGFKLGFNELLTQDMINVIQGHVQKRVPPEKMLEIIRKYSN